MQTCVCLSMCMDLTHISWLGEKTEGITDTAYPCACTVRMFVHWVHGEVWNCKDAYEVWMNGESQDCLPAFRDVYIISEALMGPNAE